MVIVGMGYVALEMAENLRKLNEDVSMVIPKLRFLPWMEQTLAGVVYGGRNFGTWERIFYGEFDGRRRKKSAGEDHR